LGHETAAWRDRAFAFKIAAAVLLALFLALWIDLPRPYWAVTPSSSPCSRRDPLECLLSGSGLPGHSC
jgi:Fusaric acid resistance protein family